MMKADDVSMDQFGPFSFITSLKYTFTFIFSLTKIFPVVQCSSLNCCCFLFGLMSSFLVSCSENK